MSQELKQIVEKINASFTKNDTEEFLSYCAEDIVWTMAGEKIVVGKDNIREWLASMKGCDPPIFNTEVLIAEGSSVVCSGDSIMKGPDGVESTYKFCDLYQFDGVKVTSLVSFCCKDSSGEEELSHSA